MGQLIKLQDYVSRYEHNIFLYPSRFVRLKQQQWSKLQQSWDGNQFEEQFQQQEAAAQEYMDEKRTFKEKIKGLISKTQKENDAGKIDVIDGSKDVHTTQEDILDFQAVFTVKPESILELKQQFLDQLFRFQMKWASSTLREKSDVSRKYYYEERLKYLLQRFPDTYLILYQPIFKFKNAPVAAENIIVTPTEVWCISFLEEDHMTVYTGSTEHFWLAKEEKREKKVLNPLIALSRTEKIVKQVLRKHEIDLPVKQAVLCRNGYIDYPTVPLAIQLIDRKKYDEWFTRMRNARSPLKNIQLKSAQALLQYGDSTSYPRLEWESFNE
ncbi:NERD domain-containing protein [Cytobacillus purgationiresistens]|uniref:NERD domain-containing protein n=1 Tax=Cytobacillus purgationiresistens TaxID=863449 RepID=A0ABU0ALT7_9BACI|nr:NERD domain-containing protein [Cytobacillus purgationiresistens]MDQ0272230.1 hypothetical protein [Cytobacillus purgationiresistens]